MSSRRCELCVDAGFYSRSSGRDVTYINISPAPPTWPVVEAQGFRRFSEGQFFAVPALSPKGSA